MRTYEQTHPWINFTLNMGRASPELWMLMGEAQSKCEHVAGIPLLPAIQSEFRNIYLVKGVSATTAIEGNTLTEEQVRAVLDERSNLPPSQAYQQQEVANLIEGYNRIGNRVIEGSIVVYTVDNLRDDNRLILTDTLLEENVAPGEIRDHPVLVGNVYRGAPPDDCHYLLSKLCAWLNNEDNSFEAPIPHRRVAFEILKAIVAHLYIAWIHPFGDGNGRTARMLEFEILLAAGIPMVSAHLLSNHYNKTRSEYYRQLNLASRNSNPMGFIEYALRGFVDELKVQIDRIKDQQFYVHWKDYVYEHFRGQETKSPIRRRNLLIELSRQNEPLNLSEIRYLTPQIAEAYAGKHPRTIDRDLKVLIEMGLVEVADSGYRARREIMLAFRSPIRP